MNKTIIINMNGIIFHIEEDAYEQLKQYMSGVKRHFAYTADSEEIVSDIESRIAEMFSEILASEKKQVIIDKDIESVISQMGSVSDFETAEQDSRPSAESSLKPEKRLYRDGDDRIIGGVSSGIGHYFNLDSKWIRLFFILLFVFFGTGFFVYLILWVVMPKANNRFEKMAMKGETQNIRNFKRSFDEDLDVLKKNPVVNQASGFLRDLLNHVAAFIAGFGRVLLKVICALIILTGLIAAVSIFVTLIILMGNANSEILPIMPYINQEYRSPLYFAFFVVTIIPLTALVLFAVRILFNHKIVTRTGVFAMLVIWLTGLGVGLYYGSKVTANFAEEASFSQVVSLKPSKLFILELNESRIFTHEDSLRYKLNENEPGYIDGRHNQINVPDIDIYIEEVGENETPSLTKKFSSKGRDFDIALISARRIGYQFTAKDSLLQFGWGGYINKNELWRDQSITLILKIPKNTVLKIDGKLNRYLRDHDLRNCIPEGVDSSTPADWVMTTEGLKCVNDSLYRANTAEDR